LRTIKNVVEERLVRVGGKNKRYKHQVPQSVPLNNRAQTRLLSPTGVFDRPDLPMKRQKVYHLR